ncbi:MarR family winged helix-turn-helix transcriptional regulator [Foetidibacter luteolus]|uniref:MarR family winged helix-turn-helix transcriptional regulator n=1 Tax=Foetidibacter luteolus TaxID=2608880 RepID=UPI00129A4157|nr:MarR family transcriptional regulator [Foetidibacter luteolus]
MKLEQAIKSTKFKSEMQKAGLNILYTAWWLKTIMSKELKEYGLTHEQYNVLRILKGKHPDQMCVRDIASRMIEKNSNVPRIIDRLELKKLAKRSSSALDKRETVVTITPAGMNMLDITTQKIDSLYGDMVTINEDAAAALNSLLEKVREKEV